MLHTLGRDEFVGNALDDGGFAAHGQNLQAVFVVQVGVEGGDDDLVVVVLDVGEGGLDVLLAQLTPEALADQLRLLQQWIVIYLGLAYTQLPVVTFTREAILLEGEAREKALRKLDQLETLLFTPIAHPRPM